MRPGAAVSPRGQAGPRAGGAEGDGDAAARRGRSQSPFLAPRRRLPRQQNQPQKPPGPREGSHGAGGSFRRPREGLVFESGQCRRNSESSVLRDVAGAAATLVPCSPRWSDAGGDVPGPTAGTASSGGTKRTGRAGAGGRNRGFVPGLRLQAAGSGRREVVSVAPGGGSSPVLRLGPRVVEGEQDHAVGQQRSLGSWKTRGGSGRRRPPQAPLRLPLLARTRPRGIRGAAQSG